MNRRICNWLFVNLFVMFFVIGCLSQDPCTELFDMEYILCDDVLTLSIDEDAYDIVWQMAESFEEIEEWRNLCAIDMSDLEKVCYSLSYKDICTSEGCFEKPTHEIHHKVIDGEYRPAVVIKPNHDSYEVSLLIDGIVLGEKEMGSGECYFELYNHRENLTYRCTNYCSKMDFDFEVAESPFITYDMRRPSCNCLSDGHISIAARLGYRIVSSDWPYRETSGLSVDRLNCDEASQIIDLEILSDDTEQSDTLKLRYDFQNTCSCNSLFTEANRLALQELLLSMDYNKGNGYGLYIAPNIYEDEKHLHGISIIWDRASEMGTIQSEIGADDLYVIKFQNGGRKMIELEFYNGEKTCVEKVWLEL